MKAVLAILPFIASCAASHDERRVMQVPGTWSERIAANRDVECRSLTGEYDYVGLDADPSVSGRPHAMFAPQVFENVGPRGDVGSVVFSFDKASGVFTAEFKTNTGNRLGHDLAAKGKCENGWGAIEGVVSGQGADTPPQVAFWRHRFKRGTDGALYVNSLYDVKWRCYAFLLECRRSGETWSRFAQKSN